MPSPSSKPAVPRTVFRGRDAAEELGHQLEVDTASQQRLDHFRDFGADVRCYPAAAHSLPGQFLQGGQGVLARLVVVYESRQAGRRGAVILMS